MCYCNKVIKFAFIMVIYVKCVFSDCISLDDQVGECKLSTECETIPFLRDVDRTTEQREKLRKLGCGFEGRIPKLCCPIQKKFKKCEANNIKGECKDLRYCNALHNLAMMEVISFFTPSCNETLGGFINICCPTSIPIQFNPSTQPTVPTPPAHTPTSTSTSTPTITTELTRRVTCELTSLPQDPSSDCCGKDVSISTLSDPTLFTSGPETEIDQYPWIVLLEYRNIDGSIETKCGGSLISGRYVLTAAHCVHTSKTTPPESVRLGEHDTRSDIDCYTWADDEKTCNEGSESIPIQKITVNALYHPIVPFMNDIALVRLNRTAKYSEFIRPICLPSTSAPVPSNLTVAGWSSIDSDHASSVKIHAKVSHVDLMTCHYKYPRLQLSYGQVCAGGDTGNICKGDSGGPLMHFTGTHYEALGIITYGKRICKLEYPGIYTNVTHHLEWIRINMVE